MKIALGILGDERWMAGHVIVRDLFASVRDLRLDDPTLSLVAGDTGDGERLRSLYPAAASYLFFPAAKRFSPTWVGQRVTNKILKRDLLLERFLDQNGIDVLFGYCILQRFPRLATLSWIPDFQHAKLPALFSSAEIQQRDQSFRQTAELSTRVVLLSRAVQDDFRARLPDLVSKTRVLSPVTRVAPSIYERDPSEVSKRYHLPERFFYLPNQFWVHKNHELAFEAVRNLKAAGLRVNIVCTGYPADYRQTNYFPGLWQKVSMWDIRDQIIYLGQIPHEDVLQLVRQSICVLNPSRFEGWGISVDEARTVGKRILASAIPSHLEQSPPETIYFDPENREDLEQKMAAVWEQAKPGPDLQLEKDARAALPDRLVSYAKSFVTISREASDGVAR